MRREGREVLGVVCRADRSSSDLPKHLPVYAFSRPACTHGALSTGSVGGPLLPLVPDRYAVWLGSIPIGSIWCVLLGVVLLSWVRLSEFGLGWIEVG